SFERARGGLVASLVLILAACGGGGGDAPAQSSGTQSLTALQVAVQDSMSSTSGGAFVLSSYLPAGGLPVSGTHWFFSQQLMLTGSLSSAPQQLSEPLNSLTTSLALPNFSTGWTPPRTLINGTVVVSGLPDATVDRLSLSGDTVLSEAFAIDGVTVTSALRYTALEAVQLSGLFTNAPAEVRHQPALAVLSTNTSLLKANPSFLAGSAYYRRHSVRVGDLVSVSDCASFTFGADPSPCGSASTIEALFPYAFGGVTYTLVDGTMQTLQGLRAWVSASALPSNVSPTTTYLVLFERGGKVYRGFLQRDGTVLANRLSDGTVVDFSIRFNKQAIDSLKAALAF
ncbi:MAG TPA: hypothetical protein VGJ35_09900, partial [Burkholderiaceae bacterium]